MAKSVQLFMQVFFCDNIARGAAFNTDYSRTCSWPDRDTNKKRVAVVHLGDRESANQGMLVVTEIAAHFVFHEKP